jgi:hypothetical protein
MRKEFYKASICYCYNDDCNQKEWEKQGKIGTRQYTLISAIAFDNKTPKCSYCKKVMRRTASIGINGDFE